MTLALHNPAELAPRDAIAELAARLLFAVGLGATTRAGRLLVYLLRTAASGRVEITDRTQFAAACGMPESTLRNALVKLEALALVKTHRDGPRQPLVIEVVTGPRPARPNERREQQLLLFPELAYVAEPPALRVADDVVACPPCDVTAETGAGHVRASQEDATDELASLTLAAVARRNGAAQWRSAEALVPAPPGELPRQKKSAPSQTLTVEEFASKYPHIVAGLDEEPGTPCAIPDSLSEAQTDIPSPAAQQPTRDVERRAPARASPRDTAGEIVRLVERIEDRVRVDPDYAWLPWSAALMVVDGPLSEHDLHECIAGCHGVGRKFTGALYRRLHTRDPPELAKRTLLCPDGSVRLHRFGYLRRALRRYGIQLDARATQSPHSSQGRP